MIEMIFLVFDTDRNGFLDHKEFSEAYRQFEYPGK